MDEEGPPPSWSILVWASWDVFRGGEGGQAVYISRQSDH